MKKRTPAAPLPLPPFRKGQVWKIGEVNLLVTQVGKTLVHYKQYKTQVRGVQTTLAAMPELQRYLTSSNAVLMAE